MNFFDVLLIGVALGLDAFIVTLSNCANFKGELSRKKELLMPISFSFFQFFMPLIGYFISKLLLGPIKSVTRYLASLIFYFLSIKLIIDLFRKEENSSSINSTKSTLTVFSIFLQAVATSIDALVVGAGFIDSLKIGLIFACITIGVVTFILVFLGLTLGKKIKSLLGNNANFLCIFILLFLATKNLILALK